MKEKQHLAHFNVVWRQLKKIRKAKGLSVAYVAKEVGRSVETVRKWESQGRIPTVKDFSNLLRVLDLKVILGPEDVSDIFPAYSNELMEMNQLLIDTAQLLKAVEYRLVNANNRLGATMAAAEIPDWRRIPYDYEMEEERRNIELGR